MLKIEREIGFLAQVYNLSSDVRNLTLVRSVKITTNLWFTFLHAKYLHYALMICNCYLLNK